MSRAPWEVSVKFWVVKCNPKSDSAISNFFQKDMIYCPIKGMNGCSGCGHATKGAGAAGIYGTRPNRGRYNGWELVNTGTPTSTRERPRSWNHAWCCVVPDGGITIWCSVAKSSKAAIRSCRWLYFRISLFALPPSLAIRRASSCCTCCKDPALLFDQINDEKVKPANSSVR